VAASERGAEGKRLVEEGGEYQRVNKLQNKNILVFFTNIFQMINQGGWGGGLMHKTKFSQKPITKYLAEMIRQCSMDTKGIR
jgi:hypothetical protein